MLGRPTPPYAEVVDEEVNKPPFPPMLLPLEVEVASSPSTRRSSLEIKQDPMSVAADVSECTRVRFIQVIGAASLAGVTGPTWPQRAHRRTRAAITAQPICGAPM